MQSFSVPLPNTSRTIRHWPTHPTPLIIPLLPLLTSLLLHPPPLQSLLLPLHPLPPFPPPSHLPSFVGSAPRALSSRRLLGTSACLTFWYHGRSSLRVSSAGSSSRFRSGVFVGSATSAPTVARLVFASAPSVRRAVPSMNWPTFRTARRVRRNSMSIDEIPLSPAPPPPRSSPSQCLQTPNDGDTHVPSLPIERLYFHVLVRSMTDIINDPKGVVDELR